MKHGLKTRALYGVLRWFARMQYDWREAASDIAAGIHSEIPTCCVAFFVAEWVPWNMAYGRNTPHPHESEMQRHGYATSEHAKTGKPPQYVPCPDCLRDKRFVVIHECTPECQETPGGSFVRREKPSAEGAEMRESI
jgi:hypothetical protein